MLYAYMSSFSSYLILFFNFRLRPLWDVEYRSFLSQRSQEHFCFLETWPFKLEKQCFYRVKLGPTRMRGYNLNPEPAFNPDIKPLWNIIRDSHLSTLPKNGQCPDPIISWNIRTLLPLDAFHSQRDGTRCELVDLQTSSGRNRQRKQCFQMLKGPPAEPGWHCLSLTTRWDALWACRSATWLSWITMSRKEQTHFWPWGRPDIMVLYILFTFD